MIIKNNGANMTANRQDIRHSYVALVLSFSQIEPLSRFFVCLRLENQVHFQLS